MLVLTNVNSAWDPYLVDNVWAVYEDLAPAGGAGKGRVFAVIFPDASLPCLNPIWPPPSARHTVVISNSALVRVRDVSDSVCQRNNAFTATGVDGCFYHDQL